MLVKGSKIKLKTAMPGMEKFGFKVGTQMIVDDICNNMILISIPCVGKGFMSLSEYKKYFEEVNLHPWTKWKSITSVADPKGGYEYGVYYKTNGRTVVVKICGESPVSYDTIPAYVKARARCYRKDKFNVESGVQLAFARAYKKFVEKRMAE